MIPTTLLKTELQLITPCFCAGANQREPELRAPSFRGELRWWFRCLGGTPEQEGRVFGTAAGGTGNASAIALLVTNVKPSKAFPWDFEEPKSGGKSSYITFFLSANKNKKETDEDKVDRTGAYLPPEKKFTLELRQLRNLEDADKKLLALAWDCMCYLGAVGARKTRGLGAFATVESNAALRKERLDALLSDPRVKADGRFSFKLKKNIHGSFAEPASITNILRECAETLIQYRNDNNIYPIPQKDQKRKAGRNYCISSLGNAEEHRQASAVRFRPVLNEKDELQLLILKAPDITLCAEAKEHDIPRL